MLLKIVKGENSAIMHRMRGIDNEPIIYKASMDAMRPQQEEPVIVRRAYELLMPGTTLEGFGGLTYNQWAQLEAEAQQAASTEQDFFTTPHTISLRLRIRAGWAILKEAFLHPLTTSYIITDPERNTVTVERNADAIAGIQKWHR